ncbi:DUF5682 family protein [Streptomyces sp. NPDC006879]|uniref:DUF5682 family protein n=1 Tax=Streptomyces sp. NPDC006879 TaxID=3364767 RepID=UPI0036C6F9CD
MSGPVLLGVRHHGPGSARAVRAALEAVQPSAVLIEGPPEGDALLPLAAEEGMRPPVALLAHAKDDPGRAAFWPLAAFSPEWVAIRWALERDRPVRFIDLPAAHSLAMARSVEDPSTAAGGQGEPSASQGPALDHDAARLDPVAVLAEAAGYEDAERWWEDVVEHRGAGGDPVRVFEVLGEAMALLRETLGTGSGSQDLVREAHMRQRMRAARREFGTHYAVVCGAWHVPALRERTTAAADRALLSGLPKVRVEMSWVPWTHRRLSRAGGYGAGITSPGWYGHLFAARDRPVERWLTRVAGLLREEDLPVSCAHVIEAVRLAETLAVVRGRPLPGLAETMDAVRAVMCDGSDVPLALVEDRLIVGEVLGEVPEGAPAVPLQRDLTRHQRSLRLKPDAREAELELDLRKDTDGARSRLLHRLRLLGVGWGVPTVPRSGTGTFRETWQVCWQPELSVRVAEAGVWGTTVEAAAGAKAAAEAESAGGLGELTALAELCLLAGLPRALPGVMRALEDRAALAADVGQLAGALPALARSLRYGDVRGTDTKALAEVAAGLARRICVALPSACAGLDADAAAEVRAQIDSVHTALALLADEELRERWAAVLRMLTGRERVPGTVRGRAVRLLLDDGRLGAPKAEALMGLALSPAVSPAEAAGWIEGFLGGGEGGGTLLLHDERLLALMDDWLSRVPAEAFTDVLPLLRRTFAAYGPGVRRSLGELVRREAGPKDADTTAVAGFAPEMDPVRADAVTALVQLLLGEGRAPVREAECART